MRGYDKMDLSKKKGGLTVRFLHTADLHLDAKTAAVSCRAALRRGAVEGLGDMIRYASERGIRYIVIAGDLYDTPHPSPAVAGRVEEMMREAKDITFLLIAGNHDPIEDGRYGETDLPENAHLFGHTPEYFPVAGGGFIGCSFGGSIPQTLPRHPGTTVGIFHGRIGDPDPRLCLTREWIGDSGLQYLALGHLHKMTPAERIGGTWTAYPGSPNAHGFDEIGPRYFLDVEVGGDTVEVRPVETGAARFWEKTIPADGLTYAELIAALSSAAAGYDERDIIRFRLVGTCPFPTPPLPEDYPNVAEILDETTLPVDAAEIAARPGLKGLFTKYLLEEIEKRDGADKAVAEAALKLGWEAFDR